MIAILILNYNNSSDTIKCIESVNRFNTSPCKFVVIDNGSTDDSVSIMDKYFQNKFENRYLQYNPGEQLKDKAPYISLILSEKNTGYACGNNYGLHFIEKDIDIDKILILNNDILFIQDIIPSLSDFLDTHSDAAIVSPLLLKHNGVDIDYNCARKNATKKQIFWLYALHRKSMFGINEKLKQKQYYLRLCPELVNTNAFQIELPSGSCMLINKKLFKSIGYFDSNTFLYYEENILHRRIEHIGLHNYMLPQVKCIHLGARTTKKVKRNYFHDLQSTRSGYYYTMTYGCLNRLQKCLLYLFYHSYKLRLDLRKKLIKGY